MNKDTNTKEETKVKLSELIPLLREELLPRMRIDFYRCGFGTADFRLQEKKYGYDCTLMRGESSVRVLGDSIRGQITCRRERSPDLIYRLNLQVSHKDKSQSTFRVGLKEYLTEQARYQNDGKIEWLEIPSTGGVVLNIGDPVLFRALGLSLNILDPQLNSESGRE